MIAPALGMVTPERSAPCWKPFLAEETGSPLSLTVPSVLKRADLLTSTVPAT